MNLYDSIKSPFEDMEVLKKLIDIYANMEEPNDDLYSEIIVDNEIQNFDKQKYINDYENLIVKPTFEELYKNLKTRVSSGENVWNIESEIWQKVFDECGTYTDLENVIKQAVKNEDDKRTLQNIGNAINNIDSVIENGTDTWGVGEDIIVEALKTFSKEELKQIAPCVVIQDKLRSQLSKVNQRASGFHVNAEKTMNPTRKNKENEIKFYINAGDDTCKVAALFREKCKEKGLNYYFKVANPYDNEEKRTDKLCIYSELQDAQNYFEIFQEIKKENPQMIFREPPILTGKVDGWLGVGSDYKGDRHNLRATYNVKMSNVFMEAMTKIFNGINRKDIAFELENNSQLIGMVKKEIVNSASRLGYSKDKVCVRKSDKRKLSKGAKSSLFDRIKGAFSKKKQLPEPQTETMPKRDNEFFKRIKISGTGSTTTRTMETEIPSLQSEYPNKSNEHDR